MADKDMPNAAPLDWDNFDKAVEIFVDDTENNSNRNQLNTANEALGQLFGITDNPVFQRMNADQQNKFLKQIVEERSRLGSSGIDLAAKLLRGLGLRPPEGTPSTPTPAFAPSLGPSVPSFTPDGTTSRPARQVAEQQTGWQTVSDEEE